MTNSKFDLDSDFVRKLAKLLEETGLSEIEYGEGDKKIRCAVAKNSFYQSVTTTAPCSAPALTTAEAQPPAVKGTQVTAPMVGTVYLSSEPGSAPFIKVGDKVKQGDTLLIIEAMKVMNPIKAPKAAMVAEILVGDAKPVEFGETLIVLT